MNYKLSSTKSLERNSRLSIAIVKNRAEQNNLNIELGHLENERKTVIRTLQHDKHDFKLKYSKSNIYSDITTIGYNSDEILSKYFIPSAEMQKYILLRSSVGDTSNNDSSMDFEEIHNMLFTNNEIDKEKILCLHLISAHRSESLTPPRKKMAYMCKIHSPVERLLQRSKRKNIHQEQKMTNMLPIYTIEMTEFGSRAETKDLINDGRLATRILLNEKVRELINTVLNALRQSNPDKNYEIFEMANDVGCLKQLFIKRKILDFLEDLMNCSLISSCESYVLTAPFRVKSIQLEIRTISGTLEALVKQIRQNVLQLPARTEVGSVENIPEGEEVTNFRKLKRRVPKKMPKESFEEHTKTLDDLYGDKQSRRPSDPEKKLGRHADTNFVQKNIDAAAAAKKVEYETDEDTDYYYRPRRSSQSSNRSRRKSFDQNITDAPHIQPIKIPDKVVAIMEANEERNNANEINNTNEIETDPKNITPTESKDVELELKPQKRRSTDCENVKYHLKQTTCPACMERYKIPLPPPKTPRIKPSSVIPLAPGENPDLKTNSKNRISMLINKEMFRLQSYERRFSSEESSRRNSLKKRELETFSSSHLNLSPLELARIEQEIKEKETQKKLEKFLSD